MELYGSLIANEGSGGGGGTADVPIKSISVNGQGVVPVNKNVNIDVPTKTSQLENDSNFASTSDIPTKTSELENDSNFASTDDIPTKVSELNNDSKFVTEDELTSKGYANTSDIPTKTSQLTNDSSFVTESDLSAKDFADKTYVGEQISQSEHLKREIVTVLPEPTVADEHTIYMLKDESVKGSDKFKEYMLIEGVVQCVGDTSVDLTDYAKKADVDASISTLQASKADLSTLKEHTDNADIHVTAKEKTTWGTVTNKVDKEEGKGLSSNDYTNEEKTKLGNIGTSQGRNIIPYPYSSKIGTSNGITWTVNDDGTITADGTATNNAFFNLTNYIVGTWGTLHAGTYTIMDGVNLPVGGVTLQIESISGTQYKNKTFTIEQDVVYKIFIYIPKGAVADNITFKPMLEVGSIAHMYEPTTESNISLKSAIDGKADKSEVCVNMLKPTLQTTTVNGVTCTNNGDGTYTLNGNATSNAGFNLIGNESGNSVWLTMPADGKIIFAKGDATSKIGCAAFKSEDGDAIYAGGIIPKGTNIRNIYFSVWKNQTLNNVVIKPMLTTNLSATYDDFVPYTGDGDTLAHNVAEIKKDLGDLTLSASGTTLTITDGTNTWTLEANK